MSNGNYQWQRAGTPANIEAPLDPEGFPRNTVQTDVFFNADFGIAWNLATNGLPDETTGEVI